MGLSAFPRRGHLLGGWRRHGAVAALAFATLGMATSARADGAPSAERLKSAAAEYDAGRRAFTDGKYEEAAVHFENAYHDAPNAQTLRNAIRARKQANELARAGTLALLAQDRYADDEQTLAFAKQTLVEAGPKLFKVTISCDPPCGVAADGRAVSLEDAKRFSFFLQPGPHSVVVSWPGDRSKSLDIKAKEGQTLTQELEAPPMPVKPPENLGGAGGTTVVVSGGEAQPSKKPFGPAVFFVGLGLTAVAGGILIWSGIDTINNPGADAVRQQCVGQGPSCPLYQQGLSSQTRTNVLIGVTSGLGLLTFVTVFLTQWSSPKHEAATAHVVPVFDVTPQGGQLGLIGRF